MHLYINSEPKKHDKIRSISTFFFFSVGRLFNLLVRLGSVRIRETLAMHPKVVNKRTHIDYHNLCCFTWNLSKKKEEKKNQQQNAKRWRRSGDKCRPKRMSCTKNREQRMKERKYRIDNSLVHIRQQNIHTQPILIGLNMYSICCALLAFCVFLPLPFTGKCCSVVAVSIFLLLHNISMCATR